ncbi:MAG: biopolymer transporter ExbD [Planctomycetes bacterium]|nr:biopolymer transporter ExbD [Planctomycetota bacterium]
MKIKKSTITENVGFNMTPMIDIVFQLIVFLMLASDFTNTDIQRVWLPEAFSAVEDKSPDATRLMVNVMHEAPFKQDCPQAKYDGGRLVFPCQIPEHWHIMIKGATYDQEKLLQVLRVEGDLDRERKNDPNSPSNRPIMIRADAGAPFGIIEKIMEAAGRALIWKIEIGATNPQK